MTTLVVNEIAQDVSDIKVMLEKLESSLHSDCCAEDNEILLQENKILKLIIMEKDKKIKTLENKLQKI